MTKCTVTFLKNPDQRAPVQTPDVDFANTESIAVGAASTSGGVPCPAGYSRVLLTAIAACHFHIAAAPTATTAHPAIGAGQSLVVQCKESDLVAVIQV